MSSAAPAELAPPPRPPPSPPRRGRWGVAWLVVLVALGVTAARLRMALDFSALLDCGGCLVAPTLLNDLQFGLGLLALHALSCRLRQRWLGRMLRGAVVLALLIAVVDIVVLQQFFTRLHWHEVLKFAREGQAAAAFVSVLASHRGVALPGGLVVTGVLLGAVRYVAHQPAAGWAARSHAGWIVPLVLAVVVSPVQAQHFYQPYLRHAVAAFVAPQSRFEPYPDGFRPPPAPGTPGASTCAAAAPRRGNVILLIVESLSAYQSARWGGIHDWVPEFDRLAARSLVVPEFYANAIATEGGLLALLTGLPPVPKPSRDPLFEQYVDAADSLPRLYGSLGHRTAFLTTGDLGFLGKGVWLKTLGFDEVEGHDHPSYADQPRFHFGAAPDHALYRRALDWMQQEPGRPFLLTLETVSTHQPYVDPETGAASIEAAFRYADREIGVFVRQLESRRFFDDGVLIIVGDHRAMVPATREELERFGDRTYARVPLLVHGAGIRPGAVTGAFSQTDLLPSLRQWTGASAACATPYHGLLLASPPQPPRCLMTRRPYDFDRIVVQCRDEDLPVVLDGAATRYAEGTRGDPAHLQALHRLRLLDAW